MSGDSLDPLAQHAWGISAPFKIVFGRTSAALVLLLGHGL
jgi:hypothetical protein